MQSDFQHTLKMRSISQPLDEPGSPPQLSRFVTIETGESKTMTRSNYQTRLEFFFRFFFLLHRLRLRKPSVAGRNRLSSSARSRCCQLNSKTQVRVRVFEDRKGTSLLSETLIMCVCVRACVRACVCVCVKKGKELVCFLRL